MERTRTRAREQLKEHWDSLLWILSSFALLYFTEFASNVLLNPLVDRTWQAISFISLAVASYCVIKIARRTPRLDISNWDSTWTPTLGFISGLLGLISFIISVWSIWRYWTLLMVSILFMGFISAVSLF